VSPYAEMPLISVPHGQCNARPNVIFPVYVGTKLHCLVTGGTRLWTTWSGLLHEPRSSGQSNHYATQPKHTVSLDCYLQLNFVRPTTVNEATIRV